MSDGYTFPRPPSSETIEWPGTAIGAGNTITRTKGRTAVHDKTIDRVEGRRDGLVNAAVAHITKRAGREPLFRHDVVIHGIRVRATMNSPHLYDFWVDNWYSPDEWKVITGLTPPREPQVKVYALGGVADQQEAAYYSYRTRTIVFFNTAYYGQVKSWVLGAVGRVLAEECGIHSIHGACVEKDGKGVLYIAPSGTGKSTSSYGLIAYPRTRFHSDDWVHVRYTYATRDGGRLHPVRVRLRDGSEVRGFPVFRWLETQSATHPDATVVGLDLEHREHTLPVTDLDFAAPVQAHAFTSEKVSYLHTNLVETFPASAMEMLRSKMENVPDVADGFLTRQGAMLEDLVEAIRTAGGAAGAYFAAQPRDELKSLLARMVAFEGARVMLDLSHVLPGERVFTNPMEPAALANVVLLRRDRDAAVVERLGLGAFMTALLIGRTPDRQREIAYNAYRAVDDEEEKKYITRLEAEGGDLYRAFERRQDVPDTLRQEVELFRVLHRACACYAVNTARTADPAFIAEPSAMP